MKIAIAVPTYDGTVRVETMLAILNCGENCAVYTRTGSLLARTFNELVLDAVRANVDYMCMLHADVAPQEPGWLSRMINLMRETRSDALSVVLPIKGDADITSTAVEREGKIERLSLSLLRTLPETLTDTECRHRLGGTLLINTGLLCLRMHRIDWDGCWFTITDKIMYQERVAVTMPEDWQFSRMLHARGTPYAATRAIRAAHWGTRAWTNR